MFLHLLIPNLCLFVVGFETEGLPSAVWPGGETEALTRLERHLERKVSRSNSQRLAVNKHLGLDYHLTPSICLSSTEKNVWSELKIQIVFYAVYVFVC